MPRRPAAPSPSDAARFLRRRSPAPPRLAIVLGSAFGGVARAVPGATRVPHGDIPGFPVGRVEGHAGELLLGEWHGVPVAVSSGRAHYHEGFGLDAVVFPVRVFAELGVEAVLLTNAAGGIARGLAPGTFMAIEDHVNLMGANPLRGAVAPGRERFVDLTQVYDPALRGMLGRAARASGARLRGGVYLAVSGPSFETPAEIRAFRSLGADAVGMSTVPEAIVARQCGLRVAGLSCITNVAAGLGHGGVSHEEVLGTARAVAGTAARLVDAFVREFAAGPR